jgi:hypothetical protein
MKTFAFHRGKANGMGKGSPSTIAISHSRRLRRTNLVQNEVKQNRKRKERCGPRHSSACDIWSGEDILKPQLWYHTTPYGLYFMWKMRSVCLLEVFADCTLRSAACNVALPAGSSFDLGRCLKSWTHFNAWRDGRALDGEGNLMPCKKAKQD